MTNPVSRTLAELETEVRRLVGIEAFGEAMDAIRAFVDLILNNPRATTRVLASEELDRLCVLVGEAASRASPDVPRKDSEQSGGTVILATELVMAGGHVEVIKDYIELAVFEAPVRVALTDCFGRADPSVAARFAAAEGIEVSIADGADTASRFASIVSNLRRLRPSTLVILVHNQDTIGICAALASHCERIIYIHHGDHHLSLGVTLPNFVHVDLANIAFDNCRHALGIHGNVYWPLISRIETIEPRLTHINLTDGILSCAVGRPEKFDARGYAFDYIELLPVILAATKGRHIHIGNLPSEMMSRLEESFSRQGVDLSRVEFVPWVSSVAQTLRERAVDLYIGSFPFGGGKAAIEAMAAGIPLLMHQNYRHRMYCGADISYPGALRWRDVGELLKALSAITPGLLRHHSELSRAHYVAHHTGHVLLEAVRASHEGPGILPPPLSEHVTNSLQSFLDEDRDIAQQTNQSFLDGQSSGNTVLYENVERALREDFERASAAYLARIAELEAVHRSLSKLFRRYCQVLRARIAKKLHV
ncbi:hypothetical protein [Pleomorphomonas sp. PLEO]|uniref:hypothetical protein n=1 Tax=Pleomorphomonas sp. PLEO TaxID=3239306 RepID=UPI00351E6944